MGQCMPSSNTPSIYHPVLGQLKPITRQQGNFLELAIPICSEEQYIEWVKDASKLKFNPTLADYLYLPVSEHYHHQQTSCSSLKNFTLTLPTFTHTLPQLIKTRIKEEHFFTELEIWYVIVLFLKCFIYGKQRTEIVKPEINNLLVTQDGHLRILPQLLIQNTDFSSQTILLKEHHSQKTQITVREESSIHKAALICLQVATLRIFSSKQDETDEQNLQQMMKKIKQRYSNTLTQQLQMMIFRYEDNMTFLQKLYKKTEPFLGQIEENMELHIKYGQYQPVNQGQSLKFLERGTPKMSRQQLHLKSRKESFQIQEGWDQIIEDLEAPNMKDRPQSISIL